MQTFTPTAGVDTFTSTTGATVTGLFANMTGDTYNFGQGTDTLVLTDRNLTVTAATMPAITGVDVIDVSKALRISTVQITDAAIAQSDNDVLLLRNGNSTIRSLSAGIADPSLHLVVEGSSAIHLANGVNNVVYVSDANTGEIIGGTGADTFYAGAGADTFTGGKGADHFHPDRQYWRRARHHSRFFRWRTRMSSTFRN